MYFIIILFLISNFFKINDTFSFLKRLSIVNWFHEGSLLEYEEERSFNKELMMK